MRADARAKRAALQTAGAELFAEQGTDVPLSAVAVRAGVGIGTLYRHFPTRGELYLGVMEAVVEKVVEVHKPFRKRLPKSRDSRTTSFTVGGAEGYIDATNFCFENYYKTSSFFGTQPTLTQVPPR